jgi:hypothetical protein
MSARISQSSKLLRVVVVVIVVVFVVVVVVSLWFGFWFYFLIWFWYFGYSLMNHTVDFWLFYSFNVTEGIPFVVSVVEDTIPTSQSDQIGNSNCGSPCYFLII